MTSITSKPVDIGTLITNSPDIWHGRTIIQGTRVPVMLIVDLYQGGMTPEQIASDKYLSLAQVYAALTYYHANPKLIEREMAEEDAENARLEQEWRQKQAENTT
jgi:uncharacterized protein (DUF433 family)